MYNHIIIFDGKTSALSIYCFYVHVEGGLDACFQNNCQSAYGISKRNYCKLDGNCCQCFRTV